eukprot:c25238_g1_i1 orf=178-1158(-)
MINVRWRTWNGCSGEAILPMRFSQAKALGLPHLLPSQLRRERSEYPVGGFRHANTNGCSQSSSRLALRCRGIERFARAAAGERGEWSQVGPLRFERRSDSASPGSHHHVCAALSSLADADGEEFDMDLRGGIPSSDDDRRDHVNSEKALSKEADLRHGGMQSMDEALNISPRTASAITAAICLAVLVLPLFMQSLGAALPTKIKLLSYFTLLCGFYMAWNIGANDVANAMGTSVGSGALTLRQAVMTAAVLEYSGAFLVGSHVSHTMQKGILVADVFSGRNTLLFSGMLASLAASGTWLQVSCYNLISADDGTKQIPSFSLDYLSR